MITKKEVEHIAKLARLGLAEKEIKKFQKELSSILDYIEKLKEVDVSNTEPTSHCLRIKNVIREDVKKLKIQPRLAELDGDRDQKSKKLLDLGPDVERGYFKVKSIF